MFYRNVAAPWLYAAGGVVLGLVGFKAVSTLKRRGRSLSRNDDVAIEQQPSHAPLQHSGENAPPRSAREGRRAFVQELLDEELEAVLNGSRPMPGDAYDAVAPDDLAPEWLSRATEAGIVLPEDEPLDPEAAQLLRDTGMSVVSEGSLNSASQEQFEATVNADLDGADDQFGLEFDYGDARTRP